MQNVFHWLPVCPSHVRRKAPSTCRFESQRELRAFSVDKLRLGLSRDRSTFDVSAASRFVASVHPIRPWTMMNISSEGQQGGEAKVR